MKAKQNRNNVVTGKVRVLYTHLDAPYGEENPKYSIDILISKDSTDGTIEAVRAAVDDAIAYGKEKKWGKGSNLKMLAIPVRDGDDPDDFRSEPPPAAAGHWVIRAKSANRPGIVDAQLQPVLNPMEVYRGSYVRVSMSSFAYDAKGNKGVSFHLNNVQFFDEGEPIGSGFENPESVFEAVQASGFADLLS